MTTTALPSNTQTPTSTDTGFLRSLLWACLTITAMTMTLALLWR